MTPEQHNTANVTFVGRGLWAKGVHPQSLDQNCETVMMHKTVACRPNAKSLTRTVGSGAAGCRAAYSCLMVGENRNAAVLMV
jgi:hypothetical protein